MNNTDQYKTSLLIISFVALAGCNADSDDKQDADIQAFFSALPLEVSAPENNPISKEKVALGKLLFWDPILSGNNDVACATCHHPSHGYADALQLSIGVGGAGLATNRSGSVLAARNAPTVLNSAFNGIELNIPYKPEIAPMFWDNRAQGLEQQATMPIFSKEEMRGESFAEDEIIPEVINKLNTTPEYQILFTQAFGDSNITEQRIARAIASFERTLVANNSRFDQYLRGDETALSAFEIEGMNEFIDVGCARCHKGPMLSDFKLHTIGTPESNASQNLGTVDKGANNDFSFRTPTLRNLNKTAPYMHNGAFSSLEQVVNFYHDASNGDAIHPGVKEEKLDPDLENIDINDRERARIITFLKTLEDDDFDKSIPSSVPSGFTPGGNI